MKELWVPAEQDVIVRLLKDGAVEVTQDVMMVKRPVSGERNTGFSDRPPFHQRPLKDFELE